MSTDQSTSLDVTRLDVRALAAFNLLAAGSTLQEVAVAFELSLRDLKRLVLNPAYIVLRVPDDHHAVIKLALAGHLTVPPLATIPELSTEEESVLLHLPHRTNLQIADALRISAKAVQTRLRNLYRKCGVSTRTGLAVWQINRMRIAANASTPSAADAPEGAAPSSLLPTARPRMPLGPRRAVLRHLVGPPLGFAGPLQ